jgi:hypothetical protein
MLSRKRVTLPHVQDGKLDIAVKYFSQLMWKYILQILAIDFLPTHFAKATVTFKPPYSDRGPGPG